MIAPFYGARSSYAVHHTCIMISQCNAPSLSSLRRAAWGCCLQVTTFDSQDCVVMAGSLNHQICQWDVR